MPSLDVVASALLLPIPVVALPLSLYNWLVQGSTLVKRTIPLLLAVLAAVAGATALSVSCGEPLRVIAKVFEILLQVTLSGVSIHALCSSAQLLSFLPPFLGFFLSLAALLVACELVSALIPTSPLLLPAMLALVSRGILLTLAIATVVHLSRRNIVTWPETSVQKGGLANGWSGKTPGRVSSPTQATWPFPGSLALQDKPKRGICPVEKSPSRNFPSSTLTVADAAYKIDGQVLLPLVLTVAQIFATLSAALNVAASILVDGAIVRTDRPLPHILLATATCTLLWSFMVLVTIQLLPTASSTEKGIAIDYDNASLGDDLARLPRDNPAARTSKPSLSRRESDSLLDFLSLRDPFASSPPPPPPLPPIGLGLEDVDVGWNGNMEIGMQYRFPAPRSIVKAGRRREKMARVNGKKSLVHQDSSRTLLPVPETRGAEAEIVGDRGFGDEARLAQLLLQSLNEGCDAPRASAPVPTVQPPPVAHVQPSSRWSTSTTVQSVVSGSVSNRSGVSAYTTCASEKVPTSRISMNTITSVLGSRKSSDARRKSAMTASSSKG